jgi:hypothetical protein
MAKGSNKRGRTVNKKEECEERVAGIAGAKRMLRCAFALLT